MRAATHYSLNVKNYLRFPVLTKSDFQKKLPKLVNIKANKNPLNDFLLRG
jgi:hypothetical protein